jgi:hypothetical protein
MAKEKPVWDKKDPDGGKHSKLNKSQKASARARAKAAGRTYPNAVDNIAVARKKK